MESMKRTIEKTNHENKITVNNLDMDIFRQKVLLFIENQRVADGSVGKYLYSQTSTKPTLYSSTYAAMTHSLFNNIDIFTETERQSWVDYFNQHQDDDGLFRDPVIFNEGWYKGDSFWCGRPHLTGHILAALVSLGGVASKEFALVHEYSDPEKLESWLNAQDWGERIGFSGNQLMNLGTLFQYARDYHNDKQAGQAIAMLLDWMDTHQINPETGVWGQIDITDPLKCSHAGQGGYHFWALYFFDKHPVPYVERAIDTLITTQNPNGGFGCGVHNRGEPFKSSACEDIDTIAPLVYMLRQTDYRRDDIIAVLTKGVNWVLQNWMSDGGFVFMLDRPFEYGHPELRSETNVSGMFPTWFRTLSLAVAAEVLSETAIGKYPWYYGNFKLLL